MLQKKKRLGKIKIKKGQHGMLSVPRWYKNKLFLSNSHISQGKKVT